MKWFDRIGNDTCVNDYDLYLYTLHIDMWVYESF